MPEDLGSVPFISLHGACQKTWGVSPLFPFIATALLFCHQFRLAREEYVLTVTDAASFIPVLLQSRGWFV